LRNLALCNGQFTWSNFKNQPTYYKFDRFLFSVEWEPLFPIIRYEMEDRVVFDHCPVLLDSTLTRWGPSPLRTCGLNISCSTKILNVGGTRSTSLVEKVINF
ncbi:Endonuclease/exonuclease/phosphatase, partial [Parasponia andersonii]